MRFSEFLRKQKIDEASAYHGSAREFDEFKLEKTLSGEGNVSFGYGIYVADNKKIGEHYAMVAHEANKARIAGKIGEINALKHRLEQSKVVRRGTPAISAQERSDIAKSIKTLQQEVADFTHGLSKRLYVLDIDDSIFPLLLDLDKPVSMQSDQVKESLSKLNVSPEEKGIALLKRLEGTLGVMQASKLLQDSGIQGTKYLDSGSRARGQGSYNYVVFNPSYIKIVNVVSV